MNPGQPIPTPITITPPGYIDFSFPFQAIAGYAIQLWYFISSGDYLVYWYWLVAAYVFGMIWTNVQRILRLQSKSDTTDGVVMREYDEDGNEIQYRQIR